MNSKVMIASICAAVTLATGAMAEPHHRGPPPPPPPLGGPGGGDCHLPSEVLSLRQEIAAIKLDLLLDLSAEQARAIHPLAQQAQARKNAIDSEKKKREPMFIAAMTAARDDLKRDGKVSEATAQKLREAKGQVDFRAIHEEFEAMRAQVDAILTDEQKAAFASFDPRPLSPERPKAPPPPPEDWNGGHPPPPPPGGWDADRPPPPPRNGHRPPRKHRPAGATMMLLSEEFIPFLEARMK